MTLLELQKRDTIFGRFYNKKEKEKKQENIFTDDFNRRVEPT